MMRDDFCVFILTHGRPDRVVTWDSLRKAGYTGKVYIVIDDEDKTAAQYRERFWDLVIQFSKAEIAKTFDEGDNFGDRRAIIYARNVCFDLAEKVGCRYFIQLDDDYTDFRYKFDADKRALDRAGIVNADELFCILVGYFEKIPALSIAIGQGGDFLGGTCGGYQKTITAKRKAMNTFICSTDRRFHFFGRINEDVNTYTNLARRGGLFLTILQIAIQQAQTQTNQGGMTELYRDAGTYVKSFYAVMYSPSCVSIYEMGMTNKRLHHKINWNATAPKILSEKWRK